jgi:biotin-(acetyl-CoA carboxylase) ligase
LDPLRAERLERLLPARRALAREIRILAECASTQDEARDRGAPAGLLVVAERQSGGRGRRARDWWSGPPAANLAVTAVVVPPPEPPPLLGVAGAAALARLLEDWGAGPAALKWPNDVLLDGRKVAGLLGEWLPGPPPAALLGLGLNVHAAPPAAAAARRARALADALRERARPAPPRPGSPAGWLWRVEAELARVRADGPAALESAFLARLRLWAPRGARDAAADALAGGALLDFRFATGLAWSSGAEVVRRPVATLGALEALP